MDLFLECVLFVAGLAFGSFLNVCISRIPSDESVVRPRSHCRSCGAPINWRDNIPLLSWIMLRGRCRQCSARVSLRYPAVELLTALIFLACYLSFGSSLLTLKFCVFGFLLIGLIFMDAETGLLPREFNYSGIVLGLVFSWFVPTDFSLTAIVLRAYGWHTHNAHLISLLDSIAGGLIGAGFFFLAWALYYLVRHKHGLGFGDIALMAMSGTFLGAKLVLLVIFFAPLLGLVWAIILLVRVKLKSPSEDQAAPHDETPFLSREMPFGVVIGACSLAVVFVGQAVFKWYLRMF
ncbi:MAG: prepilin peptidase [Candidatus Korobacteraceae bacterium]